MFIEKIIAVLVDNIIVILAAIVPLGVSAFLYINTWKFVNAATKTKGTVIRLDAREGSKGGTVYQPIYEFRTLDGQVITVAHDNASRPARYKVGQSVDVLYNTENPQNAKINNSTNLYMVPLVLAGVGIVASISFCRIVAGEIFKLLLP